MKKQVNKILSVIAYAVIAATLIDPAVAADNADLSVGRGTYSADAEALLVSPQHIRLKKGDTYRLNVTAVPTGAGGLDVSWSSSDASVATVDRNGTVACIGAGTAVVTAAADAGRLRAECVVDVIEEIDFSEWNMLTNTGWWAEGGFDIDTFKDGGDFRPATAYLAR